MRSSSSTVLLLFPVLWTLILEPWHFARLWEAEAATGHRKLYPSRNSGVIVHTKLTIAKSCLHNSPDLSRFRDTFDLLEPYLGCRKLGQMGPWALCENGPLSTMD